jgi:hypothetical protein
MAFSFFRVCGNGFFRVLRVFTVVRWKMQTEIGFRISSLWFFRVHLGSAINDASLAVVWCGRIYRPGWEAMTKVCACTTVRLW